MTVVRGTANILVTLTGPAVAARFNTLTKRCHVLALQEWPRSRNTLLARRGRLRWWPRPSSTPERGDWTFHRPRLGGGPIGVRNDLGETVISCRAVMLAGPGFVGRIPGRRSVLGPSWCTRLKTRLPDGTIKARYNFHLTASVQAGKHGYRTDEASARRVARHRGERDKLEWLIERDQRRGIDAEAYGDTNFHRMPIAGLHAWWEGDGPDPHSTFGDRTIDGIYTSKAPDDVELLVPLVRGEHWSVITRSES